MSRHSTPSWIQTFTGRQYWPLSPRVEDICIEDIAHHLSQECRYNSACREFYSVAQHSVLVSYMVRPADRLWALLHDASEAYLRDIARPVKLDPKFRFYTELEELNMRAIAERFGLSWPIPESVKLADTQILATEKRDLMAVTDHDWGPLPEPHQPNPIEPWMPKKAEQNFLEHFYKYQHMETLT